MKKTTFLTSALVVLVVLNIVLITTIVIESPHRGRGDKMPFEHRIGKKPREIIIQNLGFDKSQIKQYDVLIKGHREKIDELDRDIRNAKQELYALLQGDFKQSEKDRLILKINEYQKQIEEVHFKHFQDIKNICTPAQKKSFEALAPDFPRLFRPGPMPR